MSAPSSKARARRWTPPRCEEEGDPEKKKNHNNNHGSRPGGAFLKYPPDGTGPRKRPHPAKAA
eukprot:1152495-Prorocentrum_minimum.AAC.1